MTTLYVKVTTLTTYDSSTSKNAWLIKFSTPDSLAAPAPIQYLFEEGTQDASAMPYPLFPNEDAAIAYYGPTAAISLRDSINAILGATIYTGTPTISKIDSPVQTAIDSIPSAAGKSDKASFSGVANLAAHGIGAAAVNAATNLKTDYGLVDGLLGVATGLNGGNAAQNDLATKYNDLATKFNSIETWLNTNKDKINAVKAAGAA